MFEYSKLSTNEIFSKCIFVQFRVVNNCIGSWELGTFVCSTRMGQNDKMLHFQLPESPDLLPFCIGHYHDLTRFYNKYKNYHNIKNFYLKIFDDIYMKNKEGNLVFIKIEKIDSLDSIPSPSVRIQIIGGKVYLR